MEAMLAQDGVLYKGGVGHARMAEAYAETGFYLYPTDTQETAPINLIKVPPITPQPCSVAHN
eukprot:982716-Rhodomonas_salina.1